MARKVGQIIARGDRRWLIRVYLGRDHETKKRNYHNRTIRGSMREAQAYLTTKLRERDLGRDLEEPKIPLNDHSAATIALAAGVSPTTRTRQHGLSRGHLWSRASTHAGRGCRKSRGYALSTDSVMNR